MRRTALTLAMGLAFAGPALAACPSDEAMDALAADMLALKPAKLAEKPETMEDGLCAQAKLIERLVPELGEPIGYKVGLTSKPAQERFGADEPVHGVLLQSMLSNEEVVPRFASRGLLEADMLVTVRNDGINNATSPMEVLQHLSSVQPFIELADLVLAEGQRFDPATITAINVGARKGVTGREIEVEADEAFHAALAEMTVRMSTYPVGHQGESEELLAVPGRAILGHPLEAVLWLMNDGVKLEAGDVVSLGSFGAPAPATPGQVYTVRYEGLARDPLVSVTLE